MQTKTSAKKLVNEFVYPICISTPFAVGDVFAYLVQDDKNILVDTGHLSNQSRNALKEALGKQQITLDEIDEIWLTHAHPDHFGLAREIKELSGAKIYAHPKEHLHLEHGDDPELFGQFFREQNIPQAYIKQMGEELSWLNQFQQNLEVDHWLGDGDVLESGHLRFRVKHTPGHAPGHVIFQEESGLILAGDVLLHHISTNALINFDPDTGQRNRSLLQLRKSLEWMEQQEGYLLPGHGIPFDNISEIARKHLDDQDMRYRKIKQLLKQNTYTLFDLTCEMFPVTGQPGTTFLTLSEVMGYLDWGMENGEIEAKKEGDVPNYTLAK